MAKLNLLDLSEAKAEAMKISNVSGSSTAANPSADLTQALSGFPAAAGKAVTRQTAVRVGAVLSSVKTLAQDIAKMPLRVIEQTKVNGRIRTSTAIDHPLFPIFTYQPNRYQVPFNWQFYLATQLLMNGNAFCQKITNGDGDILELVPLDAWAMTVKWDFDAPLRTQAGDQITQVVANGQKVPVLCWDYYGGQGKVRRFYQPEIFHVVNCNIESRARRGARARLRLRRHHVRRLPAAVDPAGPRGEGRRGGAVLVDEVVLDGRLADRVLGRQLRGRRRAHQAEELSGLRKLPADPDRCDRGHERHPVLPERGKRGLPSSIATPCATG